MPSVQVHRQCQYHFLNYDRVTDLVFLQFEKDFILIHYFCFCLFRFKMLPVCFACSCCSTSSSQFQKLLPIYC